MIPKAAPSRHSLRCRSPGLKSMTAGRTLITRKHSVNRFATPRATRAIASCDRTQGTALQSIIETVSCIGRRNMPMRRKPSKHAVIQRVLQNRRRRMHPVAKHGRSHDTRPVREADGRNTERFGDAFFRDAPSKMREPATRCRGLACIAVRARLSPVQPRVHARTARCPRRSWSRSHTPAAHHPGRGTPRRARRRRRCAARPVAR